MSHIDAISPYARNIFNCNSVELVDVTTTQQSQIIASFKTYSGIDIGKKILQKRLNLTALHNTYELY